MPSTKSPAQVLFDRLIRTWVRPEANRRHAQNPQGGGIALRLALMVWEQAANPSIFLNEEVFGKVRKLDFVAAGRVGAGQPVTSADIQGLRGAILDGRLGRRPYIVVAQGRGEKFYVTSRNTAQVLKTRDFETLRTALSDEGLVLSAAEHQLNVYLDLIRNAYDGGTPAHKRRELTQLAEVYSGSRAEATEKARRHLRLPTLIIHQEDEFLPLLLEARQTYIDGHFFSCVAAAVTTADRICIRLMQRYGLPVAVHRQMLERTFGQKIQPLRAYDIITTDQEKLLKKMNNIRNRHIHARKAPSGTTTKRDSLAIVKLLHEVLEGTFSLFRDYEIVNGIFVPKPIV